VAGFRACLIDVYDTILSCDFAVHANEMPALAGIDAIEWNQAFLQHATALNDGRLSIGDAYAEVFRACGREPDDELMRRLVKRDRELLFEHTEVHADSIPFLTELRRRGVPTAIVSNCADGTRPLLEHLGLADLVDALVLSCEVGSSKPGAVIFETALDALGVPADEAVFIDDQPAYCEGARRLGITAVCMSRDGQPVPRDERVVRSLLELERLF
jgi:putative hydrolase of the HAD superfamily